MNKMNLNIPGLNLVVDKHYQFSSSQIKFITSVSAECKNVFKYYNYAIKNKMKFTVVMMV